MMRSFLVLATIISTLSSTATVAVFGIHTEPIEVTNPLASYPLAALNDDYAEQNADESSFPLLQSPHVPLLSGFLYRDAYIRSLQTQGKYSSSSTALGWVSESGSIGDTIYPGLNTSGIGLNATSYTQFSGLSSGYDLPTSYTFERLDAAVFATNVSVSCSNATGSYSVSTTDYGGLVNDDVRVYHVWKDNFPNTTLIHDRSYEYALVIGSVVTAQNGEPLHTFIFPDTFELPFIVECTYGGNEFLASISLLDRVSPIQMNGVVSQGPSFDASVKWELSNITHDYIYYYSHGAPGGILADAWISTEYYDYGFINNTFTPQLMGTILSELGEAYFSLQRQEIEIANQYRNEDQIYDNGSFVKMVVAVLRIGGASYGWLAIYGLMFISAVLGVVTASVKKHVLPWKSQDPVELLHRCLQQPNIDEVTRLRYGEQFEIIGGDDTRQSTVAEESRAFKTSAVEEVTE